MTDEHSNETGLVRPLGDIKTREDLHSLPRDEVERRADRAEYWMEVAKDHRDVRDEIAHDLESALNALRAYQNFMVVANFPDPNFETVKNLCLKYQMTYNNPRGKSGGQVFVDGKDITYDPGDYDGAEVVEDELVPIDPGTDSYYGVETVTLVTLEDGSKHFVPGAPDFIQDTIGDEIDYDPDLDVDESSRDWLNEDEEVIDVEVVEELEPGTDAS